MDFFQRFVVTRSGRKLTLRVHNFLRLSIDHPFTALISFYEVMLNSSQHANEHSGVQLFTARVDFRQNSAKTIN